MTTKTTTKQVGFRIPVELHEWVETQKPHPGSTWSNALISMLYAIKSAKKGKR